MLLLVASNALESLPDRAGIVRMTVTTTSSSGVSRSTTVTGQ